jgi:hypothetical protein
MKINGKFNNRFATLPDDYFTRLDVTGFAKPIAVSFNNDAGKLVGIDNAEGYEHYFGGNKKIEGADYLAAVYSGHQFGSYVPQLGDGRAIYIGEINGWELQLKGAGKTPYSRFGDGRAVLRSSIREYLCSEAMHYLGVPTTRALCLVGSDEDVMRETVEKGAMVTRMAQSFIRFGHFEYFYYTNQHEKLKELADFVIANYFAGMSYDEFLEEVTLRTARLMASWQVFGFTHGVMNTDNMSILGLTIDYGPFGFVEAFEPGYIPNHSDHTGRYAYDQQPSIGLWNLHALAQALSPLIPMETAVKIMAKYQPELIGEYARLMRAKLGLLEPLDEDMYLARDIMDLLDKNQVDYTNFFRKLAGEASLRDLFLDRDGYDAWFGRYKARLEKEPNPERKSQMNRANPKYILRNYLAEQAIRAANMAGDYSEVDKLLNLLKKPYEEQPEMEEYAKETPEWGKYLEISCSS